MSTEEHLAGGEVRLSLDPDDGVIRLKTVASFDDPVELSADTARELAQRLLELADELG